MGQGGQNCAYHRHTDIFEVPLWCSAEPCKMASEIKCTRKNTNEMREHSFDRSLIDTLVPIIPLKKVSAVHIKMLKNSMAFAVYY